MGNKPESSRRPRTNPKTLKGQEDLQNSGCMNPRSPEDEGNTIKKKKNPEDHEQNLKSLETMEQRPQILGRWGTHPEVQERTLRILLELRQLAEGLGVWRTVRSHWVGHRQECLHCTGEGRGGQDREMRGVTTMHFPRQNHSTHVCMWPWRTRTLWGLQTAL